MAETQIIIREKTLEYEGLFDPKELYTIIDEFYRSNHFDRNEFTNSEHVYKDGKQLRLDVRPYKKISDYVKIEVKIELFASHLKEQLIEIKGIKKKLYKGHVKIMFTGYLITDYEGSWEMKPFYYLLRMLVDKFIYKGYLEEAKNYLVSTINKSFNEIRTYLNMHRFY